MKHYFSKGELALWGASVLGIVVAFCVFDRENYLVLILLWVPASVQDVRYVSVAVCFAAFLVNDIYGYISWQKMKIRQSKNC